MASKFTRTSLIAAIAIGASGLVAVPAEAAISVPSIPTYLVNQPAVTGATQVTPESATITAAIDTGGNPGSTFPFASGTLSWGNSFNISGSSSPQFVDGLPSNLSTGNFTINASGATLNNAGSSNYSDVLFEYDPVSDFNANGGYPGPETQDAAEIDVPTAPGLTPVSTTVGAYPAASADSLGSEPLTPGTKYYYWVVQQAGATDDAEDINLFNSATGEANPDWKCLPTALIATVPALAGAQVQGPCIYYYGNQGGNDIYQSPMGTFTTPKLGKIVFGAKAKASGKTAKLIISNNSTEKAAGTITLTKGGTKFGTAKFSFRAGGAGTVKVTLTAAAAKAIAGGKSVSTKLTLTSTTDQPTTTKTVTLS